MLKTDLVPELLCFNSIQSYSPDLPLVPGRDRLERCADARMSKRDGHPVTRGKQNLGPGRFVRPRPYSSLRPGGGPGLIETGQNHNTQVL